MILVGLALDPEVLKERGRATVVISQASILVPLLVGLALSPLLYSKLSTTSVPFTGFALLVGVSMSITAFPVLARIFTDRGIHRSRIGTLALTCAVVNDVTAWCLLAFVVGLVRPNSLPVLATVALSFVFVAVLILVGRPAIIRLASFCGRSEPTQGLMATGVVAVLLSALTTELIGIHAIFGAFALGAVTPHDSRLAQELTTRLEDLVVILLLPAFFVLTGLRTHIQLV
jgi:Kef-type K+ transport system membrane component KefB